MVQNDGNNFCHSSIVQTTQFREGNGETQRRIAPSPPNPDSDKFECYPPEVMVPPPDGPAKVAVPHLDRVEQRVESE